MATHIQPIDGQPKPTIDDDKDKVREIQHEEVAAVPHGGAYPDPAYHYPTVEFTIDESRKVLRKLDWHVCVPMLLIYMLSHLDKNALSYGAVFNLKTDFHLTGDQYSWLGSIIYLAQLVVQPLSAYALVRLPIAKFVCANVLIWGAAVMCMAACKSWATLMVTRAIVGACEAPISPAFIALVQGFFIRREQSYRNIFWLLSSPIAGLFGSALAYGVGHITHGLTPYQSIFLFLGGISVVLAPILAWVMPDDIKTARFLTPHEKDIAIERLRANNTGGDTAAAEWKWYQVREVFADPKTYMWGVMLFVTAIPSSGWGIFGTLLGFGFLQSIAFQIPIAFIEGVVMLVLAWVTNKYKNRWIPLVGLTLVVMAGGIALATMPRTNLAALLTAYYFLKLYSSIQPLLYSWANQNAAGLTKMRALGGFMFVCQCAGNVVGPQVYLDDEAPIYKTGVTVDIVCWGVLVLLSGAMAWYLKRLNKRQAKRREEAGHVGAMLDTSIMTLEEAEAYNKTLVAGGHDLSVNTRAFEDLTDFENYDFQYVY